MSQEYSCKELTNRMLKKNEKFNDNGIKIKLEFNKMTNRKKEILFTENLRDHQIIGKKILVFSGYFFNTSISEKTCFASRVHLINKALHLRKVLIFCSNFFFFVSLFFKTWISAAYLFVFESCLH